MWTRYHLYKGLIPILVTGLSSERVQSADHAGMTAL